jgi:beta-phosphoglucomutase
VRDASGVLREWAVRADRAVIFDFNGTLSDDEPLLLRIFTELFDEHLGWRLTAEEYAARLAGYSDREIVERVVAEQGRGEAELVERLLAQRRDRYHELARQKSPIRPGTVALVARLDAAGVPMAVVTGAQRPDVELVLAHSAVGDTLTLVVAEEDVARGKPHPEGFLAGASLLGVDPAAVLVFEDSVAGARGAHAAGMRVLGVEGGGSPVEDLAGEADAVVPALDPRLLDGLLDEGSVRRDARVDGDPGAVGPEEVEGVLDR